MNLRDSLHPSPDTLGLLADSARCFIGWAGSVKSSGPLRQWVSVAHSQETQDEVNHTCVQALEETSGSQDLHSTLF